MQPQLLRISESVRSHTYLILSSQASGRSRIVGNTASALTAQKSFLSNFENVVNRKIDIWEEINDIKTHSLMHHEMAHIWARIQVFDQLFKKVGDY